MTKKDIPLEKSNARTRTVPMEISMELVSFHNARSGALFNSPFPLPLLWLRLPARMLKFGLAIDWLPVKI